MRVREVQAIYLTVLFWLIIATAAAQGAQPTWQPLQGPYGGPVTTIVENPNGVLFAGAACSGVFSSTDGGKSWSKPANAGLADQKIVTLVVSPAGTLYAGGANKGGSGRLIWGGVFRSTDNAATWTNITAGMGDCMVSQLALNASGDLFAAVTGAPYNKSSGLWRLPNGSSTWTQTSFSGAARCIAISSGGVIFAGSSANGVSVSLDNGATWSAAALTSSQNIGALAVDASGTLYAGTVSGLYSSTNNGVSWGPLLLPGQNVTAIALIGNSVVAGVAGSATGSVFVSVNHGSYSQATAGLSFLSGVSAIAATRYGLFLGANGAYISVDGGLTWAQSDSGLNSYAEFEGPSGIVFPAPGVIVAGSKEGGRRSIDGGVTWSPLNSGLTGCMRLNTLALNGAGEVVAGSNDAAGATAFRLIGNGNTWTKANLPAIAQWTLGMTLDRNGALLAVGSWNGAVFKSTDNGSNYSLISSRSGKANWTIARGPTGDLYVGTESEGVLTSTDDGYTWTPLGIPVGGANLKTFAFNRFGELLEGNDYKASDIWRNTNNTSTGWVSSSSGIDDYTSVRALASNATGQLFAATSSGVYSSTDDGHTWQRNSGLPQVEAGSVGVDANGYVYVGYNEAGGFYRTVNSTLTSGAPVITSATAAGTVGTAFSYTITAANNPTGFNATGLPAGLAVNTSTGVISGTPTASGTFSVTISAANTNGTGSATLTLTINPSAPPKPAITSALSASGTVGAAFGYAITATNNPANYNATGLPAGLSVSTSTGVISGTPTASGTSSVTISATNAGGTGSATLALTINTAAPVLTSIVMSPATASVAVNATQQFTATAKDQFGANMNPQPAFSWTVTGGGAISSSGLFTAGSTAGGPFTVTVASGGVNGAAQVTVTSQGQGGNVAIVSTFPGDSGPGYKDHPDEAGAVGPAHVVDFEGLDFQVHDKATGAVIQKMTQMQFWTNAGVTLSAPNDPRLLYDALSSRWFATAAGAYIGNGYLAVSTSSDPTQPWKAVQLPMPAQDLGLKIGVDKNGFYACFLNSTGNTHTMHDAYAIPKADAIAPGGPDLSHLQAFHNLELECFPATDLDPNKAANAPEVLLNKAFPSNTLTGAFNNLYLYKITWSGLTASISAVQSIPLSKTYYAPNGSSGQNQAVQPAPGGNLRADEGRRTICVYAHGGSVFSCNEAKLAVGTRPGVFWCEVRVSDGALLQEGFVDDPACDYIYPSLAVDRNGNIGLGCTRTSAAEFPSVYLMMHGAGDAPNTMRAPVLAVAGTTYYRDSAATSFGIGWGAYSSTCIDPSNPDLFWTYQEYANSPVDQQWSTAWVSFTAGSGAPSAPVISSPTSATGTVGTAFSYSISATNNPASYNATGLPVGLSINTSTGVISGTPTAAGTSSVTISATNAGGTGSATLTLTINPNNHPPTITSLPAASPNPALTGQTITFTLGATDSDGDALSYNWAFGDGSTGSGATATHVFAAAGAYSATVTVSDGKSQVSGIVTVTISTAASDPSLVGYWKFDETSGVAAQDSSGYGNTGTLVNSPVWTSGHTNGALQFNGTNQYVDCGNPGSLNPSAQLTLAAWVNTADGAASHSEGIVVKDNDATAQYYLRILPGGQLQSCISGTRLTGATLLKPNTWYYVATTYDGVQMNIYINGVLNASAPKTGTMTNSGVNVRIGARQFTTLLPFYGLLDEVRIYNRALSQTELQGIQSSVSAGAAAASPSGGATVAPAAAPMSVSRLAGSADFSASGHDAISFSGIIHGVPQGFDPGGQVLTVNFEGAVAEFTLDKKGHARNHNGAALLILKAARGRKPVQFAGGDVKFAVKLQNGDWKGIWDLDSNLTAAQTLNMTANLQLGGALYSAVTAVSCQSKAHREAKFKQK